MSLKTDDCVDDRILFLNDVEESSATMIVCSLLSLAQRDRKSPIYIVVNSYGGSLYDLYAIYDAIMYVRSLGVTVITIGLGKIMSSGVLVLAAGSIRKIGRHATVMWHYGSDSIEGSIVHIENHFNETKRLDEIGTELFVKHTKMTRKQVDDLLSSHLDIYIPAEKVIEYGIADDFLDMKVDSSIVEAAAPPKRRKQT